MKNFVLISQLGISVLMPIFLCVWLGTWLDSKYDSNWTVLFIILGVLAGARNAYVLAKQAIHDGEDKTDEEG